VNDHSYVKSHPAVDDSRFSQTLNDTPKFINLVKPVARLCINYTRLQVKDITGKEYISLLPPDMATTLAKEGMGMIIGTLPPRIPSRTRIRTPDRDSMWKRRMRL
jgi:hypothetical protein